MEKPIANFVLYYGCALAFAAAFLNAGFLIIAGISVSHLTGDVSRIAIDIVQLDNDSLLNLLKVFLAVFGFLTGATSSGYFIHHPELEPRFPYDKMLTFLGAFLLIAWLLISINYMYSIFICSFVCGAQNAMASRFKGVILRTTHLTGLLTDLGIYLGMKLKGHKIESWKLYIPLCISISFLAGALISSFLILKYNYAWLLIVGLSYCSGGFCWSLYKYKKR